MKKAALKLIPAVCMLLISAMMLGTTTYAWFSMGNSVTATGIQISAKNESGTLIIGAQTFTNHTADAAPTLTSVQAANMVTVPLNQATYNYTDSFAVKPCEHNSTAVNISSLNSFGNWSYKIADAPDSYASTGSATALTSFNDYVIYYDLYITVAAGSPAMQNLKCNASIQASTTGSTQAVRDAVRVLVASDTTSEEFYNAHTESGTATAAHTTGETVLAASVTSGALVHLRVYIYLDGEDETIYTNNFLNLAAATIDLSFSAENTTPTP